MAPLKEYARKRDFKKTAEPPAQPARGTRHRFVIQKHAATRLHYDFRLEMDGVLKSWAVPKGIPFAKGDKRLAVQVEDHPVSYINFEGTIPKGQYGGGTVMVWDAGTFSTSQSPSHALGAGKLHFTLQGKKLHGDWHLVHLRDSSQWLLIKGTESMKPVSPKADDLSALSGKTMKQLSENGAVWESRPRNEVSPFATRLERLSRSRVTSRPAGRRFSLSGKRARVGQSRNIRPMNAGTASVSLRLKPSDDDSPSPEGEAEAPTKRSNGSRGRPGEHLSPNFIEPMKARLAVGPPEPGDWIYEIKFDGYRAMAFKNNANVSLFSRNEKDFGEKFPEIVEAIAALDTRDAIIDGEIVALDGKGVSSFQLLQAVEIETERPPLYYYAFDLLRLNGKDLRREPLMERKARLEQLLKNACGTIRYSASLGEDANKLLKQVKKLELEGLIGKRKDSLYEAGKRTGAWIKLKLRREQEFVIGGYTNPEGARTHFGALLVGFYASGKLRFCGKVGTGFNTKLLAALHSRFQKIARNDCPFVNLPESRGSRYSPRITVAEMKKCHWVEPELVGQVAFSEWTRDEKLRQPAFLGLREDKSAREVVREKPQ